MTCKEFWATQLDQLISFKTHLSDTSSRKPSLMPQTACRPALSHLQSEQAAVGSPQLSPHSAVSTLSILLSSASGRRPGPKAPGMAEDRGDVSSYSHVRQLGLMYTVYRQSRAGRVGWDPGEQFAQFHANHSFLVGNLHAICFLTYKFKTL